MSTATASRSVTLEAPRRRLGRSRSRRTTSSTRPRRATSCRSPAPSTSRDSSRSARDGRAERAGAAAAGESAGRSAGASSSTTWTATTRSTGRPTTTTGAHSSPTFWGAPMLSLTAPDPRTLEIVHPHVHSDHRRRSAREQLADQRAGRRRPRAVDVPAHPRASDLFEPGHLRQRLVLVNWPMIDYLDGTIIDVPAETAEHLEAAAPASRWRCSTGCRPRPRAPTAAPDGPGCASAATCTGTPDGLAQAPYIRESRRIRAVYDRRRAATSRSHCADTGGRARSSDSVGVGMYRIDLHPSTGRRQLHRRRLLRRSRSRSAPSSRSGVENLLPAGKNIGTTHITNGAFRLHPVEWNIGEAAGALAAFCLEPRDSPPRRCRHTPALLQEFQSMLTPRGVELHWPDVTGYYRRTTMKSAKKLTAAVCSRSPRWLVTGVLRAPPAPTRAREDVDLRMTVWTSNEDQLALFDSIADEYMADHPEIEVDHLRSASLRRTTPRPSRRRSPAATRPTSPGSSRTPLPTSVDSGALATARRDRSRAPRATSSTTSAERATELWRTTTASSSPTRSRPRPSSCSPTTTCSPRPASRSLPSCRPPASGTGTTISEVGAAVNAATGKAGFVDPRLRLHARGTTSPPCGTAGAPRPWSEDGTDVHVRLRRDGRRVHVPARRDLHDEVDARPRHHRRLLRGRVGVHRHADLPRIAARRGRLRAGTCCPCPRDPSASTR